MVVMVGDCLDIMPTLDAESIDAIVTDPPYGLGFMGKAWDTPGAFVERKPARSNRFDHVGGNHNPSNAADGARTAWRENARYQEWCEVWSREALRVAKPGAHLLAFGGTRTYHRLACAIEDAGWEVRDCLVWAYAQGFPKSKNLDGEWQGWGTALKPAWEPIILARKPLRGTVAANVTEYGTGALNIDGCRIGTNGEPVWVHRAGNGSVVGLGTEDGMPRYQSGDAEKGDRGGRWPANLILTDPIFDGDVEGVVGGGEQSGGGNPRWRSDEASAGSYGGYAGGDTGKVPVDTSGTYSRFFLIPKAAWADREPIIPSSGGRVVSVWGGEEDDPTPGKRSTIARRNHHPTVKPVALMRHLVRLVTPPGGTALDPFLGSGTTALACEAEGFGWVGIEKEPEYVAIAEARLLESPRGLGL